MSKITEAQFCHRFQHGLDLEHHGLKQTLSPWTSVEQTLQQLDTNHDQQLTGYELRGLFQMIDQYDRDGSSKSFHLAGPAGRLYRALLSGRRREPQWGPAIARAALARIRTMGEAYALKGAPTSPHPALAGNIHPGRTPLSWLQGQWKCNQFVGDALTAAGVAMPTYSMPDGGVHYMQAEALPQQTGYFRRLTLIEAIQPGDVLVIDWSPRGAGTAHTEIVTAVDHRTQEIRSAGAHAAGAEERNAAEATGDWYATLRRAPFDARRRCWQIGSYRIYCLRPRRALRQ